MEVASGSERDGEVVVTPTVASMAVVAELMKVIVCPCINKLVVGASGIMFVGAIALVVVASSTKLVTIAGVVTAPESCVVLACTAGTCVLVVGTP